MNTNRAEYDIVYNGWAPCAHDDADEAAAVEFIQRVVSEDSPDHWGPRSDGSGIWGGALEYLMWELDQMNVAAEFSCDQWVGVWTRGSIAGKRIHTFIQGDTFLLAFAETVRWYREKKKELTSA